MVLVPLLGLGCVINIGAPVTKAPDDDDAVGTITGDTSGLTDDSGDVADSGGDTGDSGDAAFSVTIDPDALTRLANRMAATQNDDGSWDWQRAYADALTPAETGYQNITGISALGLRPTLDRLGGNATWESTEGDAIAYFTGRFAALAANPADDANVLSSPTWTLVARSLARTPNAAVQADAEGALNALIDDRDAQSGTRAETRMDGWIQRNIDRRNGNEGLIPWDLALLTEALFDMSAISPGFADEHVEMCTALAGYLTTTFLPAWTADRTLWWGDLSISMPLYVLADCPDTDPELLATLDAELALLVQADGSVTNGATDDGPHQATAYGLLALKRRESPLAQAVQAHAEAQVGADGILSDDGSGLETYEIEGELLRAMAE